MMEHVVYLACKSNIMLLLKWECAFGVDDIIDLRVIYLDSSYSGGLEVAIYPWKLESLLL